MLFKKKPPLKIERSKYYIPKRSDMDFNSYSNRLGLESQATL